MTNWLWDVYELACVMRPVWTVANVTQDPLNNHIFKRRLTTNRRHLKKSKTRFTPQRLCCVALSHSFHDTRKLRDLPVHLVVLVVVVFHDHDEDLQNETAAIKQNLLIVCRYW